MDDQHVQVYAGLCTQDPGQGLVFIKVLSLDLHHATGTELETPSRVEAYALSRHMVTG
jgi:hypothetical protein